MPQEGMLIQFYGSELVWFGGFAFDIIEVKGREGSFLIHR